MPCPEMIVEPAPAPWTVMFLFDMVTAELQAVLLQAGTKTRFPVTAVLTAFWTWVSEQLAA
jgi:hypothetical protein